MRKLKTVFTVSALLASCIAGLSAQAFGQADVRLYNGLPNGQGGITLSSWGSGTATDAVQHVLIGTNSIKLTTQGMYQGVRLQYAPALNIKSLVADKSAYLELKVVLPVQGQPGALGAAAGSASSYGGSSGYGAGSSRGRSSGSKFGGLGGGGAQGQYGASNAVDKPKPLGHVRIILATTDGQMSEAVLSLAGRTTDPEGFTTAAIPMLAFKGLENSNGMLSEARLAGDSAATLYVGEVRIVHDDTPIRVDDLTDRTVPVNEKLTFTGSAEAGATPLIYEWNFHTEIGPSVDATGKTVTHQYRKGLKNATGETVPFVVTLTVRDAYGAKAPVTRTAKVFITL